MDPAAPRYGARVDHQVGFTYALCIPNHSADSAVASVNHATQYDVALVGFHTANYGLGRRLACRFALFSTARSIIQIWQWIVAKRLSSRMAVFIFVRIRLRSGLVAR